MAPLRFAVTFDYRCPFARNAHEHVVAGLRAGRPWDVTFVPFSLSAAKFEPGQPGAWDPGRDSGLLALQASLAVRDHEPERFLDVHLALFALRHDQGASLVSEEAVGEALRSAGADAETALKRVAAGEVLDTVRREHDAAVADHDVWGVPTFVAGGEAAFIRLMDRPVAGRDDEAADVVERIVDLLAGWPALNELKHTSIPR